MQLHQSSWPEVEEYLKSSTGIIIPIGSTEQHGPNGLIGTDALCPEIIAKEVGDQAGILVGPTLNVGIAQHHLGFAGSMAIKPSTMIAVINDWVTSLRVHGFDRFYFLNGHGGNIATINAAFVELYGEASFQGQVKERAGDNRQPFKCLNRNWWEGSRVGKLRKKLYGNAEGSHATPSEVAVTYAAYPDAIKNVEMSPKQAPWGGFTDAEDYRGRFADGRIGSDPSLANPEDGQKLIAAAAEDIIEDFQKFAKS